MELVNALYDEAAAGPWKMEFAPLGLERFVVVNVKAVPAVDQAAPNAA